MEKENTIKRNKIILCVIAVCIIASIMLGSIIALIINLRSDQTENDQFQSLVGNFTDIKVTDADSAIAAAQDAAKMLGLENAADELTLKSENTVDGITYYRLQQKYQDILVYGSEMIIAADSVGETRGFWGNTKDISKKLSMNPTITQKQIEAKIQDYFDNNSKIVVSKIDDKQLVIYNFEEVSSARLAYQLYITVDGDAHKVVLDAQNGEIYKMLSLTYYDSDNYVQDVERNMFVYNSENLLFSQGYAISASDGNLYYYTNEKAQDSNGNIVEIKIESATYYIYRDKKLLGTAEYPDDVDFVMFKGDTPIDEKDDIVLLNDEAQLLLNYAKDTYDFYKQLFHRDGFDNNKGKTYIVYDCLYKRNDGSFYGGNAFSWTAFTNKTLLSFGNSIPLTYDLVAHEYMHSVEGSESSMEYQGQSGAIMEGYSDIFGELVEDWTKNNEEKLDGNCDWIHGERNLIDPNSVVSNTKNSLFSSHLVYPSEYKGKGYYTGKDDNGGVHHNSTVISHSAYLMTQDILSGTKLTTADLARLWYNTMLTLPSNCTFSVLRENMEMTAKIIGFSDDKVARISAAFDEVGIYNENDESISEYSTEISVQALTSFDGDIKATSQYKIIIEGKEDKLLWFTKDYYSEIDVTDINPIDLTLEKGEYTISVTDGNNTYSQKIKTRKGSDNQELTFITEFLYVVDIKTPSESDFEAFTQMFEDSIVVWDNSDNFTSANLTTAEIIDDYITYYMFCYYLTLFDSDTITKEASDPLNKLYGCRKFEGEKIDWILENVFNKTPDHNSSSEYHYYYDGNWYIEGAQGVGDHGMMVKSISEEHKQISGNKYQITIKYIFDNYHTDETEKWEYVFVTYFNYDKYVGNYWSIESLSKKPMASDTTSNSTSSTVITENSSAEEMRKAIIGRWWAAPTYLYVFNDDGSCKMLYDNSAPGTFEITDDKRLKIKMSWTSENLAYNSNSWVNGKGWCILENGDLVIEGIRLKKQN